MFFFSPVATFCRSSIPQSTVCLRIDPLYLNIGAKKGSTVFSSARKLFRSSGQIAKDLASVITLSTTQHLSIGLPKGCNICFCPSATTCRINEIRCEKEVISKTARIDAFLPRLAKNMLANVRNTLNWLKLISLIDSYTWASVFRWRPWLFIGQFTI